MPSVAALMQQVFEPISWLVKDIIPEGVILVAGRPKSGKSWLGLNVTCAAAMHLQLLGRDVKPGEALYLGLEDNARRMQRRVAVLMAGAGVEDAADLAGINIEYAWPTGAAGAAKLDAYLTANPRTNLAVVDVLKCIRAHDHSRTKNDYEKDYEAIQPWKVVAEKHRITLILIHHTRKATSEDPFDDVSGTLGLNGVVDQIIILKRHGKDKTATLYARGRDLEEDIEMDVELQHGWWLAAAPKGGDEMSGARERVLVLLTEGPKRLVELSRLLGVRSVPSLSALLKRMETDGQVLRVERGLYARA